MMHCRYKTAQNKDAFSHLRKGGLLVLLGERGVLQKTPFLSNLYIKTINLPRRSGQTQEKLRKKGVVCRTARRTEQYSFAEGWMVQPKPAWLICDCQQRQNRQTSVN
jgi:hypothetical protein